MQARTNKDSNQRKILEVIIEMAKKMNMTTVAEGIETADSEQMLKELSCDYGQGYYYSKPIPVAEFKEKFENNQAFKIASMAIGTILGIVLIYGIFLVVKKFHKWLKR